MWLKSKHPPGLQSAEDLQGCRCLSTGDVSPAGKLMLAVDRRSQHLPRRLPPRLATRPLAPPEWAVQRTHMKMVSIYNAVLEDSNHKKKLLHLAPVKWPGIGLHFRKELYGRMCGHT